MPGQQLLTPPIDLSALPIIQQVWLRGCKEITPLSKDRVAEGGGRALIFDTDEKWEVRDRMFPLPSFSKTYVALREIHYMMMYVYLSIDFLGQ